jgi:hypothetical protein
MTFKSNKNIALTFFVIMFAAFVVAGLAVVPSLQEANANELTLLAKDTKHPNYKKGQQPPEPPNDGGDGDEEDEDSGPPEDENN